MFDNTKNNDSYEADRRLRKNLRRFDRNSLKILHPLFRDALRLLAQRHQTDKRETLLLPLVSLAPPIESDRQTSPFAVVTTGRDQPVHLHH
ncbi:hypothetical protein [Breoghania sp. JC706]|uniref:hypothetical protein n=1 Tax=Breoghania sp. JC706 TaxID=3117732 RepID=UPI00300BF417